MWCRKVGLALVMATALGVTLFPPKALADSNARIVRLSYVEGNTQIDRRDGRGFDTAFLNMPLAPGTRIATQDDGRAEIEFEDGSTARLTPNSLLETQSLVLRSSGGKYTLVDLSEGTAYFDIRSLHDDDDFHITAGHREFSLNKSSRFRLRVDRSQVELAVFNGEVEVMGEGAPLNVRKNESLTLDMEDPSRYYLAKGVTDDPYDQWDKDREDYRDRYAIGSAYNGYSPYYSYGATDLNYWGSYGYYPGYGYMWRPYYYGVGWNPYSDGAWYWYAGSGWIWVSPYPWGWMPFRYGGWYFVTGTGWCWRPGSHWNRWSPVVAIHNPPAGHPAPVVRPPATPPAGGHHAPVVVGRGPATILPPEDALPHRPRVDAVGRRGGNPPVPGRSPVATTPGSTPTAPVVSPRTPTAPPSRPAAPVNAGGGQPATGPARSPVVREPGREVGLDDYIRDVKGRRPSNDSGSTGNPGRGSIWVQTGPATPQTAPAGNQGPGSTDALGDRGPMPAPRPALRDSSGGEPSPGRVSDSRPSAPRQVYGPSPRPSAPSSPAPSAAPSPAPSSSAGSSSGGSPHSSSGGYHAPSSGSSGSSAGAGARPSGGSFSGASRGASTGRSSSSAGARSSSPK